MSFDSPMTYTLKMRSYAICYQPQVGVSPINILLNSQRATLALRCAFARASCISICIVHCALAFGLCIRICIVHVHLHFHLHRTLCTCVWIVHCALCIVHCALCIVHCALCVWYVHSAIACIASAPTSLLRFRFSFSSICIIFSPFTFTATARCGCTSGSTASSTSFLPQRHDVHR